MARNAQQIFDQNVAFYVAQALGAGITIDPTQWSMYNIQRLLHWTVANGTAIFEQILDAFTANAEVVAASAAPQNFKWLRKQMLLFQYDAANPQIIQFDPITDAPIYIDLTTGKSLVNTALRIITSCSVTSGASGSVTIKTAKGGTTPIALTTPELNAVQSYVNMFTPGINYNVISLAADKLYAAMTVKYIGQYSNIISTNVVAAIQAYLLGIDFNGAVSMDDLVQVVRSVTGVTECVLNDVQARADTTVFGSGTSLVASNTWLQNSFPTISGYIIGETDPGNELTNSITYIAV